MQNSSFNCQTCRVVYPEMRKLCKDFDRYVISAGGKPDENRQKPTNFIGLHLKK